MKSLQIAGNGANDALYPANNPLAICLCKCVLRNIVPAVTGSERIEKSVPDTLKQDCHLSDGLGRLE